MHLNTLISLLAVGAAAAPAAPVKRTIDLNNRVPMPTDGPLSPTGTLGNLAGAPEITPIARRQDEGEDEDETSSDSSSSSSSSAAGLIPELPSIPLLRRQDPEPTEEASTGSLEEYLETFDGEGEYDEEASDAALDRYHKSLDGDKSSSTTSVISTSTSVAPEATSPVAENVPVAETKNATEPVDTKEAAAPVEPKNTTTTESLPEMPAGIDLEKLMGKTEAPKEEVVEPVAPTAENATLTEAPKNETMVEAPKNETMTEEPKKEKKAKKEKKPKKEKAPKEEVVTEAPKNETMVEEPKEEVVTEAPKNETIAEPTATANATASATPVATPKADPLSKLTALLPVKRQAEAVAEAVPETTTTPAVDEKTIDSNATAVANTTDKAASEGFHGINKHMQKLKDLGLPIKRQEPDLSAEPEVAAPDAELVTARPASHESTEAASAASPLYKFLVPLPRQHEPAADVAAAAPSASSEETEAAIPAVESLTKRDSISSTTTEVVPDADPVDAPAVPDSTVPDTGLDGLISGLV